MTIRAIRDDVQNVLDYLAGSELASYANTIAMKSNRVTWHAHRTGTPFLTTRGHPGIDQYVAWVEAGEYSAVLYDGSLLQITYELEGDELVHHRLAYVPCPFEIDRQLLVEGEPLADVISLYVDGPVLLRSALRFDYSPAMARTGHPPMHFTFNSQDCRIPCSAPMHVLRFVDFVFRNFYPRLWSAHSGFFLPAKWRHLGEPTAPEREIPHLNWDYRATQPSAAA